MNMKHFLIGWIAFDVIAVIVVYFVFFHSA